MEFLADYGLFFAKLLTVLVGIIVIVAVLAGIRMREKSRATSGHLEIRHWNEKIHDLKQSLQLHVLDKCALKNELKADKAQAKEKAKAEKKQRKKSSDQADTPEAGEGAADQPGRVFVVNFHGDMRALAVDALREEITAILSIATAADEVVIRLESGGGMVHAYGLAASQLQRIKQKGLRLTVCVDKVAASGGYMMACVADKILAAPFAVMGSIGVVAQLPNFHRLLKKHDVDYELLTAGEYKRTLTMLGENTSKGRAKFQEDLEDTHVLFKEFVAEHRPNLDIEKIATGEIWFGKRALERGLVDELETSDAYLVSRCDAAQVYEVKYVEKKPLQQRFGISFQSALDNLTLKWLERLQRREIFF
ncbi:MAG: protease SohB [Gammaproteobacteria bacterium]|nr:protease SohB [Gammaproteobacteria bacterium]